MYFICKFVVGDEFMTLSQKHFDETVKTLAHLLTAVVSDNEWHLEFGVLFQVEEFPRVEVGDKVAITLKHATHHPMV